MNQLLFVYDMVLVEDSRQQLWMLDTKYGLVGESRKLRVNLYKSKVIRCSRVMRLNNLRISLNKEDLEEIRGLEIPGNGMDRGWKQWGSDNS